MAYAARLLGVTARIFVPCTVNEVKRKRIGELGASIAKQGKDITEARDLAVEYSARTGAFVLDDATNPNVAAGAATIACEVFNSHRKSQPSGCPSATAP